MKLTPEKKLAFLTALASTASVTKACEAVGIARMTAYQWRDDDEDFRAGWERAKKLGAEALEDEAVRRAHGGVDEPVFYQGVATDTVRKYSDTLLIFLLKGAIPEKYADRNKTEITSPDGSLAGNAAEATLAAKLAAIQQAALARKKDQEDASDDNCADLV